MKVNSREALETGSLLVQKFGSWSEVRRHSRPNKHGVMIVRTDDDAKDKPKGEPKGS
jgi:hypothetical protein